MNINTCIAGLENSQKTGDCSQSTYMVYSIQEGDENDGRNIFAVNGKNCGIDRKNGETDAAALAWETGMKHGDILLRLKEMEEKIGWLHTK